MKKAAILTEHRARNFGSCLQVYALQELLKTFNLDVNVVDYRPQAIEDSFGIFINDLYRQAKGNYKDLISFYIKTILFFPKRAKREYKFKKFRDKFLALSSEKYSDTNIVNNHLEYDYFFYGSDQIWNPVITHGLCDAYFAGPFNRDSIHASYAASIGLSHLNGDDENFRDKLRNLDFISVRENTAKDLLQPLTEKEIEVVLDPTLVVGKHVWSKVLHPIKFKQKYILVYSLKVDDDLIRYVQKISEEKEMDVIFFDIKKRYGDRCISDFSADPTDFVSYINEAEYVVTNSFHGTVFSILFEKKFICVPMANTSSRMLNLLESLNLNNRIYCDICNIDEDIDYKEVEVRLKKLKRQSIEYIRKVVNSNE